MYRRRSSSLWSFVLVIILGGIAGIFYLLNDNPPQLSPPVTPTVAASAPIEVLPTLAIPTAVPEQATLLIPKAGVAAPIINIFLDGVSWDVSLLGKNIGHLQGTATFDQPGNIGLVGHVEMADGGRGIFTNLGELTVGDLIVYRRGSDERFYTVRSVSKTAPDDMTVLYPSTQEQLTLITCDQYDLLTNSYLERIVVVADRV
jgi:LPXTG-site transpeptidase (sortase) family protein